MASVSREHHKQARRCARATPHAVRRTTSTWVCESSVVFLSRAGSDASLSAVWRHQPTTRNGQSKGVSRALRTAQHPFRGTHFFDLALKSLQLVGVLLRPQYPGAVPQLVLIRRVVTSAGTSVGFVFRAVAIQSCGGT